MSENNSLSYLKHERIQNILYEENYHIDSDLSDYEDVVKPSPYGAHLSEGEDMEEEIKSKNMQDEGQCNTSERKDDMFELKETIQSFYEREVLTSLDRKKECEDIAYRVTHKIIRKIQTADSRFRANSLVPLGIPYDGLHRGEPISFDMMLQLHLGKNSSLHLVKDDSSNYARIQPNNVALWEDCMDKHSQCISPKLVLRLLHQYLKRAVYVLRKYIDARRREKLPANLESLQIESGKYNITILINGKISVNVLPAISIPDCRTDLSRKDCPSSSHVVAVPVSWGTDCLVETQINNSIRFVWKFSFFVAEKNKMRTVGDGCGIKLIRILTEIRDKDERLKPLSAYHLKTIFFHETDQYSRKRDWSESKISKRFLSLLRRISKNLEEGICPSYFMQPPDFPLHNLFENIAEKDLRIMQEVIDEIVIDSKRVLLSVMNN